MKKKFKINFKWYIAVIIVCTLIFSIMCWAQFARGIKRNFGSELLDKGRISKIWDAYTPKKTVVTRIDAMNTFFLTKEVSSVQVAMGKDDWLFYKSETDGNTIADFEGTNYYSQNQLDDYLAKAYKMQNEIEQKGMDFLLFIPPNKESVYYDYMPDNYKHAEISRTDLLTDYLEKNNIKVVNPKQELIDNKANYLTYQPYDTHWNDVGAYIGAKTILDKWDIGFPSLSERKIKSYTSDEKATGGLIKMIGLADVWPNKEIFYDIEDLKVGKASEKVPGILYTNPNAKVKKTLFIVGDSFREKLAPILSETFEKVYAVHRYDYLPGLIDKINPDYVIVEYVERYSGDIGLIDLW